MASNIETPSGGYDVHVIEKYPKELNCGICTLIIHNAMHGCINHAFCKSCIMEHIECGIRIDGNVKCPGGCGLFIDPAKLEPNKFADRMINTLTTKCGNENCMWQGDLLDLVQVHQTNCDYLQQSCSNTGCSETFLQKNKLLHEEACLFKLIQCSFCHTNIFRKKKENHELKCSNERMNCAYYHLGCEKQIYRKDVNSHEEANQATHMRLIQQNLTQCLKQLSTANNEIIVLKKQNNKIEFLQQQSTTSNNEITLLKNQNATSKKEIILLQQRMAVMDYDFTVLKQENSSFKKELHKLEIKSDKEVYQLKEELKAVKATCNVKFDEVSISGEIANIKDGGVQINKTTKVKVVDIDSLTRKLTLASHIYDKVSLLNNGKIMIVKRNNKKFNLDWQELSECYYRNSEFDYLIRQFGLGNNKDLMLELFTKIPCHLFQYTDEERYDTVIFPFILNDNKNFDLLIPHRFRITISNNEITVQILVENCECITLYIGNYQAQLQTHKKFYLNQLRKGNGRPFAHGYAFIDIMYDL